MPNPELIVGHIGPPAKMDTAIESVRCSEDPSRAAGQPCPERNNGRGEGRRQELVMKNRLFTFDLAGSYP